jgi:uncharacterized membrane protein (DUF106 family)
MFGNVLDPLLNPFLVLPDIVFIFIIALFFAVITNVAYKFLTNQSLMKDLKTEMKEFQKEIKQLKNNPEKAMKVQREAMNTNMKYMRHSMKPMLITFLPIILIFGWMNAHLAYEPLMPGEEFPVTLDFARNAEGTITLQAEGLMLEGKKTKTIPDNGELVWVLSAEERGTYTLEFETMTGVVTKEVIVSGQKGNYSEVITVPKNNDVIKKVTVGNDRNRPLEFIGLNIRWIWLYLIFAIGLNLGLKKLLNIY